ncbi:MAG: tRNA (adenosine(37)-N6)-dimethylallyltransferase MiaA [Treponema sp.]|nr:tRNA (adenosine(37)-N6)-dimethylallyltransferase MiaA [Treponema sp.]
MSSTSGAPCANCVVLAGPTAVGKTALGVLLAAHFGWEIISADSRQVYRGLDIGSGKDLSDYTVSVCDAAGNSRTMTIPFHLIDITTLDTEYNVFDYQRDFYAEFRSARNRAMVPFVVGGTGMYLDAVIRGYDFVPVPRNPGLRASFAQTPLEELGQKLLSLRPNLHNKSDLLLRDRVERALEIELFMRSEDCRKARERSEPRPDIRPLVLYTTLPRPVLRKRIADRLHERLGQGLVHEVEALHAQGYSWKRLEQLGLEYRFVSEWLEGKIESMAAMEERLYHAICQFAKRQETWFRGMQKKGVPLHPLPAVEDKEVRFEAAVSVVQRFVPGL